MRPANPVHDGKPVLLTWSCYLDLFWNLDLSLRLIQRRSQYLFTFSLVFHNNNNNNTLIHNLGAKDACGHNFKKRGETFVSASFGEMKKVITPFIIII